MSCHDDLFRDKRIVVMGLGRFGGGVDCAAYAAQRGGHVLVTDLAAPETLAESRQALASLPSIAFRLGGHAEEDFLHADMVLVNPAIAADHPLVTLARRHGALVTTQINLFLRRCPATVVGITGSNGKSTTAALTAHLLDTAAANAARPFARVWLGGNIGKRPLLCCLDQIGTEDVVVLELSSFQTEMLEGAGSGPKIALLTNLTPNHLDRHGSFEAYCATKETLFRAQPCRASDPAVSLFCDEDPVARSWFERYGAQEGRLAGRYGAADVSDGLRASFAPPGRANRNNLAGALAIVATLGLGVDQVAAGVATFRSLPHRLELVSERGGVRWYNDSISTTPESAIVALDAFEQPRVLIAGGYDKGSSFAELGLQIAAKAKGVVLIGQTGDKIADAIAAADSSPVEVARAASLAAAVAWAGTHSSAGDVVILSPGCASYDMFDNFEHRGSEFRRLACSLTPQRG